MIDFSEIQKYISKKRPEGLIIDTNLLILFLIGRFDRSFICDCGLTCGNYEVEDYDLLCKIIKLFKDKIIITPYIIAEVSNLSKRDIKDHRLVSYIKVFVDFLNHSSLSEKHVGLEKFLDIEISYISNFGFTDMAIFELAKSHNVPFITDDNRFYQFASSKSVPCIKFQLIKYASLNSIFKK